MERIPQSVAKLVVFRAILASDGKTPATGKTIAITISKNGGAFGNPNAGATNATEISSGFYKFTLDTTDTGTVGPLVWRGAESSINDAADIYTVCNDVDSFWDEAVDGAITARESMRLLNSAAAGKLSGANTTNVLIRDLADTKDRIDATVDADGNRTAVTRDVS